jgi:hypothetical protein
MPLANNAMESWVKAMVSQADVAAA